MNQCLLIGIGGVYNYGCEAIVRGTERILHHWYPQARVAYASPREEDDRRRLGGCPVQVVSRPLISRYHPKNVARKVLSLLGSKWTPMRDRTATIRGYDAVLSIGGDLYTIQCDGSGPDALIKLGDVCKHQGVPYVVWGASIGPFEANSRLKTRVAEHLARVNLITARESTSAEYLKQLGITQNVVQCADPAFTVAPEIVAPQVRHGSTLRIGINLSPLSAIQCGYSLDESAVQQAGSIQRLMDSYAANIVLLPHVVCDFNAMDDDRRYLARVRDLLPVALRSRVDLVADDSGFIGIKRHITECDLVIAARMHCAINAVSAHVPALILAYSSKASGMGRYIYDNDQWSMPLREFTSESFVGRVGACLKLSASFRARSSDRLDRIRSEAYGTSAPL